ncbi:hypothetical protein O6H91_01G040500 [Diphasiastrum complanatum]|uniref:Uncharacterized protein n=1 Tax=Diphasiastrum complanatum TaxID=34168 RepID=A0ACC2EQD8_DIPCM|nr:hypothetical protein O6H91_01G040500 [Diphasiastrum complanatum]
MPGSNAERGGGGLHCGSQAAAKAPICGLQHLRPTIESIEEMGNAGESAITFRTAPTILYRALKPRNRPATNSNNRIHSNFLLLTNKSDLTNPGKKQLCAVALPILGFDSKDLRHRVTSLRLHQACLQKHDLCSFPLSKIEVLEHALESQW